MDLSTVEGKLQNQSYRNMSDFANDIRLIWSNTETYNGRDHLVTTMAHQLREIFEKVFENKEKYWRENFVKIPYTKRRLKRRPYPSAFKNCTIKKSGRKTSNSMKANIGTPTQSSSHSKTQTPYNRSPSTPSSVSSSAPVHTPNTPYPNNPYNQMIMTYNLPPVIASPRGSNQRRTPTLESPNTVHTNTGNLSSTSPKFSSTRMPSNNSGPVPHYGNNYSENKQSLGNIGASNVVGSHNQNIRLPMKYIRIYFEKWTIKTSRNSLASIRERLRQCFKMNNNFRLHYWDEDGIKIDVFDEKCFNIFLQSNLKKNLIMEKTRD